MNEDCYLLCSYCGHVVPAAEAGEDRSHGSDGCGPLVDPGKFVREAYNEGVFLEELMVDVWAQFALEGVPCYQHDGGLSTLEIVCDALVTRGLLEQHPRLEQYRLISKANPDDGGVT